MYTKRVQYAIDNFIMEGCFLDMRHSYHLKEDRYEAAFSDLGAKIGTSADNNKTAEVIRNCLWVHL